MTGKHDGKTEHMETNSIWEPTQVPVTPPPAPVAPTPAPAPALTGEFNPLVSITDNASAQPSRTLPAVQIVDWLRTGTHCPQVATIRKNYARVLAETGDPKAAKKAVDADKKKLPGIMFSGIFRARGDKNLEIYSQILCADVDGLAAERVGIVYDQLAGDPHCFTVAESPSGFGVKALCRTTGNAEQHERSVAAMAKHFREAHGLEIDPACKNLERLCFAPDNASDWNFAAIPFDPLPIEPKAGRVKILAAPSAIQPSTRIQIAEKILGAIQRTDEGDFCECPGKHLHTTANAAKDCKVMLDGKPTIKCFHASCAGIVDGVNHELRSQIGKVERPAIKIPVSEPDGDGFDKITSALRGEILGILMDKTATPAAQRREVCERVIAALNRVGNFFFHAELRDFGSALFFNRFTKRLERVRADAFVSWISSWLCVNKADTLFKYVIAAVETESLSGERTTGILPESFWAARPGAIYISCGDGQAVKITAGGIKTVDNGADSILFYAGKTCAPWQLVTPQDIFGTCAIFRDVHATAGHAPDLLRAWIYSVPTNSPCKPPLLLVGEVAAGKTALAKSISQFYGIAPAISKVEEMTESNFWPCVNDGGIYCLDNADTRTTWLADTVAAAATDGSSRRRKLYCDSETVILKPRAWLILTSNNPTFGSDSGLADRLLVIRMERRESESSDSALADEIAANRNAGLSHLAETLHKALADTAPTPGGLNHRHPDFAAFAVRIGRAIDREAETVTALRQAEADKSAFCLEVDTIGAALLAYLSAAGQFTGTAAELVPKLQEVDADLVDKLSAKRLGKRLTALWPHLKKQLATAKQEKDRKSFTIYTLKAKPAECAESETPI